MPNPKQIFPLPFVDGPRQTFSKSRRNKARANCSGHLNDVTNRAIAALNGLARGGVDYVNDSSSFVDSSSCVNVEQTLQASQILQRQARVIGEISSAARAWVSRPSRRGDKDVADNSNHHRDIGPSSSSVDQLDSPSIVDVVHADARSWRVCCLKGPVFIAKFVAQASQFDRSFTGARNSTVRRLGAD